MPQAFIIMQIGNEELDLLCEQAMVPAIKACGFEPRRVDKHNRGGLLKSEIIQFIQESDIIVADLTNERPNVYLEVGFTMGVDKFRNLILTAREDHFVDHPKYVPGGPKIHFDLAGYDILAWAPNRMEAFRVELEKRIRRRLATTAPAVAASAIWDPEWLEAQRKVANAGLAALGRSGYMEVRAALTPPKLNKSQSDLNEAARHAQIHTFGWPIAVYLDRDDSRPRPRADGICAEVSGSVTKESYDYWAIRRTGDFYFAGSLFEDERRPGELFFNTRIVRVTESLLYIARLYSKLGVDRSSQVSVAVRHGGLRDRVLTAVGNRSLHQSLKAVESEVEAAITTSLDELEGRLVDHVETLLAPLFQVFDFFTLGRPIYEDIVNRFVKGEIS
jgi:hypothetical protein